MGQCNTKYRDNNIIYSLIVVTYTIIYPFIRNSSVYFLLQFFKKQYSFLKWSVFWRSKSFNIQERNLPLTRLRVNCTWIDFVKKRKTHKTIKIWFKGSFKCTHTDTYIELYLLKPVSSCYYKWSRDPCTNTQDSSHVGLLRFVNYSVKKKKLCWNIMTNISLTSWRLVFSSPEPKSQLSFSDHNLSVVRCRCRYCRRRCRKLFTLSSSSPEPLGQFQPNLEQSSIG